MSFITPIPVTCPTLNVGPHGLEICLPGGGCISAVYPGPAASDLELCRTLIGQLQSAMTPLVPFFDVIQAVLCLKDVVTAIPDGITNLDPAEITEKLDDCIPKLEKLLQLVPQLSVPATICQTLATIICILDGTITSLERLVQDQLRIEALAAQANGPTDPLFNIVECANALNQAEYCQLSESLGPLNSLIALINILLELIGVDPIPPLGLLAAELTIAIDQLRVAIIPLEVVSQLLGCGAFTVTPRC